jgi:hypothetical protein
VRGEPSHAFDHVCYWHLVGYADDPEKVRLRGRIEAFPRMAVGADVRVPMSTSPPAYPRPRKNNKSLRDEIMADIGRRGSCFKARSD